MTKTPPSRNNVINNSQKVKYSGSLLSFPLPLSISSFLFNPEGLRREAGNGKKGEKKIESRKSSNSSIIRRVIDDVINFRFIFKCKLLKELLPSPFFSLFLSLSFSFPLSISLFFQHYFISGINPVSNAFLWDLDFC